MTALPREVVEREHVRAPVGVPLVDLLDRVPATGVVISGDLVIAIADVPLIRLSPHALLASASERVPAPWSADGAHGGCPGMEPDSPLWRVAEVRHSFRPVLLEGC